MEYTTYTRVLLQDTDCLSRYGDLHHKDKIVTKLSYSYNGNSYTDNMTPDGKVHGANMEPTWVLLAPDGPHAGPMNLAIQGHLDIEWAPRISLSVQVSFQINPTRTLILPEEKKAQWSGAHIL